MNQFGRILKTNGPIDAHVVEQQMGIGHNPWFTPAIGQYKSHILNWFSLIFLDRRSDSCLDVALQSKNWPCSYLLVLSGCDLTDTQHQWIVEQEQLQTFWWDRLKPDEDDELEYARAELHLDMFR